MTAILGISAFYHDSAAALIIDGEIVAAAQEERFTRKKHDAAFPQHAIEFCLGHAGVSPDQLAYVGFYDKPFLKFERLLETYLTFAPSGFQSFLQAMPLWLRQKLHLPREIRRGLGRGYRRQIIFTEHHESHAASAFFPSPFEDAAILTLDGVGEYATASFGRGEQNKISLSHELHFPHSLGLLYSAFTYYTGFKVNSGEYKLMGLAPYGVPEYEDLILERLLDLKDDGSFRMDMSYFNYCQGLTMTSRKFDQLFGGPPRLREEPITQRHMNLAASVQRVTEEIMLRCARHVHAITKKKSLCLAGGVALNCVGNGRILREGPFERIWIQPAAGDAGGAIGAAMFIWHQLLGKPRIAVPQDSQRGSLLGPSYSGFEIEGFLNNVHAVYCRVPVEGELLDLTANLIAQGKVVGWFQGRMEFGPRALGSRSILGDARSHRMQSLMNLKIKFRESFRPFAPSILKENTSSFFEVEKELESPYMLLVAPVRDEKRIPLDDSLRRLRGIELLHVPRSDIPAVTHVDYSARLQTVDPQRHGRYWRLLDRFRHWTGCPVIINTSFNVRGEPIVCTPEQAYRCFMATEMDALVLEDYLLLKEEQPKVQTSTAQAYLEQFDLD